LQAVAYGKKYGVPVLRWINPVRNCDDKEYSVDIIESLLPGAVQYFVLGAPANIIQNHNPVSTGIVNGTRVLLHSLVWREGHTWKPPVGVSAGRVYTVPRPAYMVVVLDVQGNEEQQEGPQTKCGVNDLIPLQLEPAEDVIQQVRLKYKKFPLDLGFATTFHKVQGQTLRRVIMFLHERPTKQLAKLIWESLYVAMTRVKSGDDMRVCYRGSDAEFPSTEGLKHLKKLKRPELYDAWLAAYDKNGNWDDTKLKLEAARDGRVVRQTLRRVTCLSRTSRPKLKEWCGVLDVEVKYKSGTRYKNKGQYLEALRPIWLACRNGNVDQDGQVTKRNINVEPRGKTKRRRKNNVSSGKRKKHKKSAKRVQNRRTVSPGGRVTFTNTDGGSFVEPAEPRYTLLQATNTEADAITVREQRVYIRTKKQELRDIDMKFRVYAKVEDENITYGQFHDLAVKGHFTDDAVIGLMLRNMCPDVYVPTFVCDTRSNMDRYFGEERRHPLSIERWRAMAISWVRRIESGRVLMLPYNWPVNVHWVALFVWKDDDGECHVQSRNSYAGLVDRDHAILAHAQKLITKIYRFSKQSASPMWNDETAIVPRPRVTEQCTNECAFHVVANGVLAKNNQCFSHTFNNDFVNYVRNIHIALVVQCRRTMSRNVVHTIDGS
jgi:hypothetical protein